MKVRTRNVIIDSDYSTQEPRILYQFCNGKDNIFDKDIYVHIASIAFNLPYEECLDGTQSRQMAKKVLLGIIYGQSMWSVAKELNCNTKEAEKIRDAIYKEFPDFKKFEQLSKEQVKEKGYTTTIWGRRRHLPDYNLEDISGNKKRISRAERQIINSRIQGSAADMIKKAISNIYNNSILQKMNIKILLPIHDELLIQVPIKYQDEAKSIIEQEMTQIEGFNIPLKCDITVGDYWE